MGKRLSKIYTRTGDQGETGLGDGTRIAKDHARIQAIGAVDEINCHLGLLIEGIRVEVPASESALEPILVILRFCQHRLFDLGGELSIPDHHIVNEGHVKKIETALDDLNQQLTPLENFILPGGSRLIAEFHLARSVCRRTERDIVTLQKSVPVNPEGIKFLNRLSDYLFVSARFVARELHVDEVLWKSPR